MEGIASQRILPIASINDAFRERSSGSSFVADADEPSVSIIAAANFGARRLKLKIGGRCTVHIHRYSE
jgi:hypothetical protein